MKFIVNLCLYLIWLVSIWTVILVFVNNANIYSWVAVIGLVIVTALISNKYDGKNDE